MTQPAGYRGPLDSGRDRRPADQVMRDGAAQNLIAAIVQLHEDLCVKLDRDVELAAMGSAEPASGRVTGSGEHDQMHMRKVAVEQAEAERRRQRKNALEELRRVIYSYEIRLGRRSPRRARVESIDYRNGADRRVG